MGKSTPRTSSLRQQINKQPHSESELPPWSTLCNSHMSSHTPIPPPAVAKSSLQNTNLMMLSELGTKWPQIRRECSLRSARPRPGPILHSPQPPQGLPQGLPGRPTLPPTVSLNASPTKRSLPPLPHSPLLLLQTLPVLVSPLHGSNWATRSFLWPSLWQGDPALWQGRGQCCPNNVVKSREG